MGKTYRRNLLNEVYGSFEGYYERNDYHGWFLRDGPEKHKALAADIAYEKRKWSKKNRDGAYHGYPKAGGRKAFSRMTSKMIRRQSRLKIHLGMTGEDWDNIAFPTNQDGKQFIWSIW